MLRELITKTFQSEVSEGEHLATLLNWSYSADVNDSSKDYIIMTFSLDSTHTYKRNMFERDISIMLSQVRRQLNRSAEDLHPTEFFDELVTNKIPFKLWVYKPTVFSNKDQCFKRVHNIRFEAPITGEEDTTPAPADDTAALMGN